MCVCVCVKVAVYLFSLVNSEIFVTGIIISSKNRLLNLLKNPLELSAEFEGFQQFKVAQGDAHALRLNYISTL